MVPERFLEERLSSVNGGGFEQFLLGCEFLSQEMLKPFTEVKAFDSKAWSVVLHVVEDSAAYANRKKRRK